MRQTLILAREAKKFKHIFDLLLRKPGFNEDIEIIRKKWNVDLDEPKLIEGDDEYLEDLLEKHKIDKGFRYCIRCYIISGDFEARADPGGIETQILPEESYGLIKIKPETRLADVRKAFTRIKEKLPKDKTRNRVPKNHDTDVLIIDIKNTGKSYKETKQILRENYHSAGDEFDLSKRKSRINKRIARIR